MVKSEEARAGLEYKWVVLINTTIGVLMASLDNSIVTIALPSITRDLHASIVAMMWVMMGYSLVITSVLLPVSRLADMKGRVRIYNIGFALFTVSSALCGFAQSGEQLVLFRLIQGVGAACLYANGTALVTDAFPAKERGFALGLNLTVGVSGFILGTVLGGVITQFLGWRYIFYINLPFGIFATIWAFTRLHEIVEPERKAPFDIGGMVTFPLSIASLLAGLTYIVLGHWGDPVTTALLVLGAALLVAFVFIERRVDHPMMDLSLFRIRLFLFGNISMFLNALARGATMFVMSWYFQAVLGDSPLIAGVKLLPLVITMMALAPLAGRLSDRFGSRWLSTLGLAMGLAARIWMSTFALGVSYVVVALALALTGLGNALFNSPNTSAVMGAVPSNRRGVAAGTRTLLNNSGQSMAIAMTMVVLSTVMSYHVLAELFTGVAAGGASFHGHAFMRGFHEVFFVGAIITAVAMVCSSLRGREDKGEQAPAKARSLNGNALFEPASVDTHAEGAPATKY